MFDDRQIARVQFLLFHQHLLAHADLSKIVEQAGIAQFAHLVFRELHGTVRTVGHPVDGFCEPAGECRDAGGMTARGWVPRFNSRNSSRDKSLKESLNVFVQSAILDRHGRLRCERRDEVHGAGIERQHFAIHHLWR